MARDLLVPLPADDAARMADGTLSATPAVRAAIIAAMAVPVPDPFAAALDLLRWAEERPGTHRVRTDDNRWCTCGMRTPCEKAAAWTAITEEEARRG